MSKENIGGMTTLSEDVVATIAALAAKKVEGVYGLGRASFRDLFRSKGERSRGGVEVEVGQKEVAIDMDIIVIFGHNIQDVAQQVKKAIYNDMLAHTGLEAVEVNIVVSDIHFEEPKIETPPPEPPKPKRRVQ